MTLRGRPHVLAGVALCVAAAGLLSACAGQSIPGHARASVDASPADVAGLPITEGPSGLRPGVKQARLAVHGYAGTSMDKLAVDALSDVSAYWRATMPKDFGKRFAPIRHLNSFDSRTAGGRVCGHDTKGMAEALYCRGDDSVSWDRGALLPAMDGMFGQMGVLTVMAHEVGQAVQYRIGTGDAPTPTLVKEQQADCYTGAFIRWAADGNAPHFRLSTGDGLNEVLAATMFVRDDVGGSLDDPQTHGSSFDRVTAFQFGFTEGPVRCSKIDEAEVRQRIDGLGFTQSAELKDDDAPVDDASMTLLAQSLAGAFRQTTAAPPKLVPGNGICTDGTGVAPTSYCPADNTIAVDEKALSQLADLPGTGPPGAGSAAVAPTPGDFAAFAEVASRYALAVQHTMGMSLDDTNAGLRTACLTGAWAGVIRHHISTDPTAQLLLGPGDLDEAVAELLSPTSMIAADVRGTRVPAGFARVSSFQDGFLQGSTVCTSQYS
jgi:predicted metalloprotease